MRKASRQNDPLIRRRWALTVGSCFLIFSFLMLGIAEGWIAFTDATEASGIRFVHTNGAKGEHLFPETVGSGGAFLDYDNDGWLDIYLVNGGDFQGKGMPNALYRNSGDGTFKDVTETAGVSDMRFGIGVCVGDYNGDGWEDLYICNYNRNTFYRNNGDGTFTDVTETAKVGEERWSASGAFFDFDNDGDLDLYATNYLRYSKSRDGCAVGNLSVYCSPDNFNPETDILYRNNGDSTFSDVSQESGITAAGRGLGVICGDYDDDGDMDIFVANDKSPNFLYRNRGNGAFEEVGFVAGIALSEDAVMGNGMGIDLADFDNDGGLDLVVTNFQDQVNTLYRNDRNGFFTDVSYVSGTGALSLPLLAWGCSLIDMDNDGWKDLFVVNGHVHDNIEKFDDVGKYAQPKQLFQNQKNGTFLDMSSKSGEALMTPQIARGAAFGDYDNDGDVDVLINNLHSPATLLRNDSGNDNSWLRVVVLPVDLSIGARVWVETSDSLNPLRQMQEIHTGGGYASNSDLRLIFGVGNSELAKVWVEWKDGAKSEVVETPTRQKVIFVHP